MATSPKDGDLTIETLYSLGFDRELVDFAVYQSNDDLFDAVDNLLEEAVRVSAQPTQYQLESSEPCPFRQKPAAKQKPPATHTSPIRYGIKRMNIRTSISQGNSVVEALASSEVAVKTNVPLEYNKEIVDLTGNDIKTERTLDPSTHKASPNGSKPKRSFVDTPVKVEETLGNDFLTEQNAETTDPIENDSNVVEDQGVGADNNVITMMAVVVALILIAPLMASPPMVTMLMTMKGASCKSLSKMACQCARNQVSGEMTGLENHNDLDEPIDQWAENLLRHLRKPLIARLHHYRTPPGCL
ncbi:hypothetical protein BOTNAR_2337g00010 [Botryotinia narcissicola]|uniref:UBA domain-containing protein n=1 Tax=Botryotinia narcissicola TaxID=278944 RepID=A0A4Z1H9X8_9HELO|nr:hypothetical protein BOTNAR_2337g00010 [Botryotinia narcissicola]